MRKTFLIAAPLASVLVLTGISVVACACDWWGVQGVIDWSGYGIPNKPAPKTLGIYPVYASGYPDGLVGWKWDQPNGNGNLKCYTCSDGDIFLPLPVQIDKDVLFKIMAGAVLLSKGPAANPNISVDSYQLWIWEDVNNDGKADADDLVIKGKNKVPQVWRLALEVDLATAEDIAINRASDILPRVRINDALAETELKLEAGKTYLILIRAVSEVASGTNLQCSSDVVVDWPSVTIVGQPVRDAQEGWQSDGDKRYTANWSPAVEDREVLWIRVNNPPAYPTVP